MTSRERAEALVGDMPWMTEHLSESQLADLPKQIAAGLDAAVAENTTMMRRAMDKQAEQLNEAGRAAVAKERSAWEHVCDIAGINFAQAVQLVESVLDLD